MSIFPLSLPRVPCKKQQHAAMLHIRHGLAGAFHPRVWVILHGSWDLVARVINMVPTDIIELLTPRSGNFLTLLTTSHDPPSELLNSFKRSSKVAIPGFCTRGLGGCQLGCWFPHIVIGAPSPVNPHEPSRHDRFHPKAKPCQNW